MNTPDTLYFSLHADYPGTLGEPPANELSYPGYERVRFDRLKDGTWTPASGSARSKSLTNGTTVSFPECNAGGGTASYWAASSSDNELLIVGTVNPCIHIGPGCTPEVHLVPLHEISHAIETANRGTLSHVGRAALRAIRPVVADAIGHPARDAALKAIDRATS